VIFFIFQVGAPGFTSTLTLKFFHLPHLRSRRDVPPANWVGYSGVIDDDVFEDFLVWYIILYSYIDRNLILSVYL